MLTIVFLVIVQGMIHPFVNEMPNHRDVCCIHLNKEGEALYELKKMDLNIEALELSNENVVKGQVFISLFSHVVHRK